MAASRFITERDGDVSLIRFHDPATMNALTFDAAAEFRGLLETARKGARALVLAGSERAFCSGFDLGPELEPLIGTADVGLGLEDHINPAMLALRNLDIPLVTAVRGAAAGVGASIALMGDIIVAGRSAYFLQSFCRIGLIPDGGSPWLLARTIGRVRAMELMMLGDKLFAETAFDWGLVTRLVDDAEVETTALDLAHRLAAGPAMALALTRRAGWAAADSTFEEELHLERRLQRDAGFHPDFREGVSAFRERRRPRFSGQRDRG